jgi:hypothetical protein
MRALFRVFSAHRVRYLIIGGQASILYGAAHFSQDLDIWIDPRDDNVRRFVGAMEDLGARVHKLTPPLARAYLDRGHGFHFLVPLREGRVYLDVMGRPPRVGSFTAAWKRSESMPTPWGRLPVVSIPDLVELKKTNRPADYDVITRLALIRIGREDRPSPGVLRWAIENLFRVEDVLEFLRRFGNGLGRIAPRGMRWTQHWMMLLDRDKRPSARQIDRAARELGAKAQKHQALGRRYWLVRIEELRRLRSEGRLLPEGTPVTRTTALGAAR